MATEAPALAHGPEILPETASVHWRPRVDDARLRRSGTLWTLTTLAHVVPFAGAAALLMWLNPLALPVAVACLALVGHPGALRAARRERRAPAGPRCRGA